MFSGIKEYISGQRARGNDTITGIRNGTIWSSVIDVRAGEDSIGRYIPGPIITRTEAADFARPDNIILTNIGINDKALAGCSEEMTKELTTLESIISNHHQRGADELPHRD